MEIRRALTLYLRSTLNLALAAAAGLLILAVALLEPRLLVVAVPAVLALYAAATVLLLLTRRGARAVVAEAAEDRQRRVAERIARYREMRERIAFLRLADEELRLAVEHFLLASGRYLERCAELQSFAPPCDRAIEEVREILQLHLEGLDEASTERRYESGAAGTAEGEDLPARAAEAVHERARLVQAKSVEFFDELTPEERLRVLEEMEEL